MNKTIDNKDIFPGDKLFDLRSTHGISLEIMIDEIINKQNMAISWIDFIDAARNNKWKEKTIYDNILYGLRDGFVDKNLSNNILDKVTKYMEIKELIL